MSSVEIMIAYFHDIWLTSFFFSDQKLIGMEN